MTHANSMWQSSIELLGFLENVALRKRAWQVHSYENPNLRDYMNASKAVDGLKTDLSFSEHQCTQSANFKDQALWVVDLGRVLGIHHITIYYRTDNVPWGKHHENIFSWKVEGGFAYVVLAPNQWQKGQ